MVNSRFGGIQRNYSIYINEKGMPSITLLNEQPTEESNGLEVRCPVKMEDIYSFESAIRRFFARIDCLPVFKGKSDFVIEQIKYTNIQGNGWKTRADGSFMAFATMGVVSYPINIDQSQIKGLEAVVRLPLDIKFKIGELKARLEEIQNEIKAMVESRFTSCKNLWDAKCLLWNILKGEMKPFKDIINTKEIKFAGESVSLYSINLLEELKKETNTTVSGRHFFYNEKERLKQDSILSVIPHPETLIYINDLKAGALSRARYFIKENNFKNEFFIINPENTDINLILKALGREGDVLPLTSSLPKIPRNAYSLTDKAKSPALILDFENVSEIKEQNWEVPQDFDIEAGGVFVGVSHYNVGDESPYDYYNTRVSGLSDLGVDLSTVEVFGLKKKLLEKIKDNPKWVHLNDYIKDNLKTKVAGLNLGNKLEDFKAVKDFEHNHAWIFKLGGVGISVINSVLAKFDQMKSNAAQLTNARLIENLITRHGVAFDKGGPSYLLENEARGILESFPMLKAILRAKSDYYDEVFKEYKEEIKEYINKEQKDFNCLLTVP